MIKFCADCGHLATLHTPYAGCRGDFDRRLVSNVSGLSARNRGRLCHCKHNEKDVQATEVSTAALRATMLIGQTVEATHKQAYGSSA